MWSLLWMYLKAWMTSSSTDSRGKKAAKASAKGAGFVVLVASATSVLQKDIERRDVAANLKMDQIEHRAVDAVGSLAKLVEAFEYQRRTESAEQREATRRIESWVFTLRQDFQRTSGRAPDSAAVTPVPMTGAWQIAGESHRRQLPKEN